MSVVQLLLGRHGPGDHYLGGRFRRPDHRRRPYTLAFPLSNLTIHLFEHVTPSQRRDPVSAQRIFPSFSTRYEITALVFSRAVEAAGGRTFNAESRPTAELDERYADLYEAAQVADLAFFKRPTYAQYLALVEVEAELGALREDLIEANVEHFASAGHDVVVRLGRIHSRVQRLGRRGFQIRTRNGSGSFFPEQILKRKAVFGLEVREEDRLRAYVDRLLRIVPIWDGRSSLPAHGFLLALSNEELESIRDRFEAAVRATRSLPGIRELLDILAEVAGYQPDGNPARGDLRFQRLRARPVRVLPAT
jgi:hypothetical protein